METCRMETMAGYTQAELDALNAELEGILGDAAASSEDALTTDDVNEILTRHAEDVAGR